jgi:hypothetical protein
VVVVIISVNETSGKPVQITGAQGPNMLHMFRLCQQNEMQLAIQPMTSNSPQSFCCKTQSLPSSVLATWYAIFNLRCGIIHTINLTYFLYCSTHVSKSVNQAKYVAVPSTLPQQCLIFITTVSHELRS